MEIRTLDVAELFTRRFIRAGEDVEIEEAEVPYEMLKILGYGGHGLVEQVQDVTTGTCYARKTFRVDRGPIKDAKKMLYNEVQVIRDLAPHPHVIRVHATYIAGRTLAIVLDPVADGGDLAKYLAYYRDLPETHAGKNEGRRILCRAFGCLAHTLAYIHSDQLSHKPVIRHKDIKPKNILIHQGFPILTDFGISKRCIENVTTTGGRPQAFSAFYCAPEVADYDDRNRSADIFSLGCVFLEMVMALYPDDFEDISLAVIDGPYHTQIESICLSLSNSSIPSLAKVIS
ncbi:kinase-like protein, partial [Polyplosphaeria fusca]